MNADETPRSGRSSFHFDELPTRLTAFAAAWPGARACAVGRSFVAPEGSARLRMPFAATPLRAGESIAAYVERLEPGLGRQFVVLLQAGAIALGAWQDDELLLHKVIKKYVVRGHGRAQPTHAKTRGKSRYGSRLRLQNWKHSLVETNERLHGWWTELGVPRRVFFSAPIRSWPELWEVDPRPPFERDDDVLQRVPIHVHRPDHEELLAVRRWLVRGCVEFPS